MKTLFDSQRRRAYALFGIGMAMWVPIVIKTIQTGSTPQSSWHRDFMVYGLFLVGIGAGKMSVITRAQKLMEMPSVAVPESSL